MILLFLGCWVLAVVFLGLTVTVWEVLNAGLPDPPELMALQRERDFWRAQARAACARLAELDDGGPSHDDRSLPCHAERGRDPTRTL